MPSEDFLADKASALVHMAESFLQSNNIKESGNSLGEKYQVFLHINANAASIDCKVSQSDNCTIDNKRFLTAAVAKRLACDASISTVLEDDVGNVLNISRRSRIVPRASCEYVMAVAASPVAARITTRMLTLSNTGHKAVKPAWRTW